MPNQFSEDELDLLWVALGYAVRKPENDRAEVEAAKALREKVRAMRELAAKEGR
jgi:hypothetical protein